MRWNECPYEIWYLRARNGVCNVQYQGRDAFESSTPLGGQGVILARCRACHSDSGIQSVQSRLQWMKSSRSTGGQMIRDTRDDPIA
jgi:hypothetical protein